MPAAAAAARRVEARAGALRDAERPGWRHDCLRKMCGGERGSLGELWSPLQHPVCNASMAAALASAVIQTVKVADLDVDGRFSKESAAAGAGARVEAALEELVVDVLRLHGADADDEIRVCAADVALRLVQAAAGLAARGAVRAHFPPMLFQVALLTADAEVLCGDSQETVVQCFRAFRAAGTAEQVRGKLALTKAVVLFLRRTVVRVNPAMSGRVRKELMSTVPAWDISGINLTGRCDVANVVEYDRSWSAVVAVDAGVAGGASGGDDRDGGGIQDGGTRVDRATYGSVWGMQRFLSNPALCEEEAGCGAFLRSVEAVQTALDSARLLPNDRADGAGGAARRYLTAPELLDLQLKDVHFRRNIVLQIFLALHALRHRWRCRDDAPPTPNGSGGGGGVVEDAEGEAPWKATVFAADGKGKGNDLIATAERLLAKMDEEADAGGGSQELRLSHFVESALWREEVWIDWKEALRRSRKPGATLPRSANPSILQKRRHGMMDPTEKEDPQTDCQRLSKAMGVRDGKSFSDYDGPHLHREDGRYRSSSSRPLTCFDTEGREGSWARMDKEERRRLLREDTTEERAKDVFLRDLKQDLEDDPEMEEEYRKCSNPAYVWRALRELGSHDLERMLVVTDVSAKASGRSEFDVFDIRRAFEERRTQPSPRMKPSTSQSPCGANKSTQGSPSAAAPSVDPISGVAGETKTAIEDDAQQGPSRGESKRDGEEPAAVELSPNPTTTTVCEASAGATTPKSSDPAPMVQAPGPSATSEGPAAKTFDVYPPNKSVDAVPTSGDATLDPGPKDAGLPPKNPSLAQTPVNPTSAAAMPGSTPVDTEMAASDAPTGSKNVVKMQVDAAAGED